MKHVTSWRMRSCGYESARCSTCGWTYTGPSGENGRTSRVSREAKKHTTATGHTTRIAHTFERGFQVVERGW